MQLIGLTDQCNISFFYCCVFIAYRLQSLIKGGKCGDPKCFRDERRGVEERTLLTTAVLGELCSRRCRQGVFCALFEKISFLVNFLPYVFFILDLYKNYCPVVWAFVPRLEYLFLFVLGSAIVVCFLRLQCVERWTVCCVVIQSDCVVCYLFSHGDDPASVSLASGVTTNFELERKVWDFRNMLSCRASVWFWNNPGGARYSGTVEGLPSQQAGPKSVTVSRGVFERS